LSAAFETILGHNFARPDLLREALTHRSVLQGRPKHRGASKSSIGASPGASNERLEFIGDRVLGLVMAEWLAERFPHEPEGHLGPRLAQLVSQPVLVQVAEDIGLGAALSVAPGEARAGVAKQATVLGDALEAALGALYLDGGLEVARAFIRRAWEQAMIAQVAPPEDPKTALQIWAQKHRSQLPIYIETARSGPPHAPIFTVQVRVDEAMGEGEGGNKRAAEQQAAENLMRILNS
jgi:ribonuclease-3